jgi:RNA polymerase sigma-70 factor, ECF subfamily
VATCFIQTENLNEVVQPRNERRLELVSNRTRESRLVLAAQRGDAEAFDELCRMYRNTILDVAQRITRNPEDAQDAVQDSLLSAYIALPKFHGNSSFKTWLTRIAINAALMIVRRRRGSQNIYMNANGFEVVFGDSGLELVDKTLDPEKALLQIEKERVVRDSVKALPKPLRTVAQLRRFEERSIRETASLLGVSISSAKTRLFRSNKALRKSRSLKAICHRSSLTS